MKRKRKEGIKKRKKEGKAKVLEGERGSERENKK